MRVRLGSAVRPDLTPARFEARSFCSECVVNEARCFRLGFHGTVLYRSEATHTRVHVTLRLSRRSLRFRRG